MSCATSEKAPCCCPDCSDLCNSAREAAGMGPLPDELIFELEGITGCPGTSCIVQLGRTTEIEWLGVDQWCLGFTVSFVCSGGSWQVGIMMGFQDPDFVFNVNVNCTSSTLVDWFTFRDLTGYMGCGQPPNYLETLRFRILDPS